MNHKNTKPMDYQAKLTLPVKRAFDYRYGMQDSRISLTVPVKKVGNSFSTLSNVHLLIEVDDVLNTDGMRITNMYIDRESIYELIKEIQGRKGFPAQLG